MVIFRASLATFWTQRRRHNSAVHSESFRALDSLLKMTPYVKWSYRVHWFGFILSFFQYQWLCSPSKARMTRLQIWSSLFHGLWIWRESEFACFAIVIRFQAMWFNSGLVKCIIYEDMKITFAEHLFPLHQSDLKWSWSFFEALPCFCAFRYVYAVLHWNKRDSSIAWEKCNRLLIYRGPLELSLQLVIFILAYMRTIAIFCVLF